MSHKQLDNYRILRQYCSVTLTGEFRVLKKVLFILLVSHSLFTHAGIFDDENAIFNVVINHEEQYSIWPVDRENALGWKNTGFSGTKQECLEHIEKVWTDMRPLSLRKQMKKMEAQANKAKRRPE